jgi:methanogenic corrinoid protein MtbC1
LTTLSRDTLRVWERRYGFPKPIRLNDGSRVYPDAQVRTLRLLADVIQRGYRPSDVVGRSEAELKRLAPWSARALASPASEGPFDAARIVTMVVHDEVTLLRQTVRRAALFLGASAFVTEFAYPALSAIGDAWEERSAGVRHEHVLTEIIRGQLHVLRMGYDDESNRPSMCLATLPGELHSVGIELVALFLAAHGVNPIVVGASTPREEIAAAARAYHTSAIGLSAVCEPPPEHREHVRWIVANRPTGCEVIVGGNGADTLAGRGVAIVKTWGELERVAVDLRLHHDRRSSGMASRAVSSRRA